MMYAVHLGGVVYCPASRGRALREPCGCIVRADNPGVGWPVFANCDRCHEDRPVISWHEAHWYRDDSPPANATEEDAYIADVRGWALV